MKKYKGFQISWWIIFIYSVLIISCNYILNSYFKYVNEYIKLSINHSLILLPIIIGIIFLKKINPYDNLKNMLSIKGFNITLLPFLILMSFCSIFFITYITSPFNTALDEFFKYNTIKYHVPKNIYDFLINTLFFCVIFPVLSEILFRSILIKLLDKYGTAISVLISSLAYSMIFFKIPIFMEVYLFSVLLCIIRLGTDSVLSSIFLHISNNFFIYLFMIFKNKLIMENIMLYGIQISLSLIFIIMMILFYKFYSKKFYFIGSENRVGFSFGFLNTVVLFIIFALSGKINF